MFGFFSKKPSETGLTQSPDAPKPSGSTEPIQQLRTPSPSVAPSNDLHVPPSTSGRPSEEPEPSLPSRPEPTTESLHALVSSVPPKTLHAYTMTEIGKADESMLNALAAFFATLSPPPRLHCVRCHADYMDVENTERSCHVAHDDDTAEVERGGPSGYQTLWGCCEKITPGDGSEGPPDGWCYEGFHTTDIKRARFRADSTPTDDKLKSCLRLNCHGVRDALPRRAKRRREQEPDPAEVADDAASSGTEDSGVAEIARGVGALGKKPSTPRKAPKSRGRPKQEAGENGMDVDDTSSVAASASASAKKARAPRSRKAPGKEGTEVMDVDASTSGSPKAPASVKRPRGRPRKESTKDGAETGAESDAAPVRRGRKPKQQSSARAHTPSQVEVVLPQRTRSQSRNARAVSRARTGAETDNEGARTDGEGRQRKKRRVAAPASDD
ncbi:unnamed protein product [Peniophora sp. CBMAI 1063]|nr:unnamed protein product [Peniophora sp. CBMAI 1063]